MTKKTVLTVPAGLIEDFPPGPLDVYRKKCTFDWKQLKLLINGEDILIFKKRVYDFLSSHTVYAPTDKQLTLPEERLAAHQKVKFTGDMELLPTEEALLSPLKAMTLGIALNPVDPSFSIKLGLGIMFRNTVFSLGTERHRPFIENIQNGKITGCFCLTEIAHGSNARQMKTTATYNPSTKEFIIHTPEPQDAKCWAGNLGESATHAVVYAQLYTPDGHCQGLHAFIVPVRDPYTLKPYPGITVGDMGLKAGLNGLDNGFVMFNQYRIPRENLLNRTGCVSPDGRYVSPIKDSSQRFGESLSGLSGGRAFIVNMVMEQLKKAMTIAVRYGALRKQFGPESGDEIPILEYQLHQWRLLPYLAGSYVLTNFGQRSTLALQEYFMAAMSGNKDQTMRKQGAELHALLCAGKSVAGWLARDGIQEAREACGGHGYLKVSGLSDLRNTTDPALTYEGDNNVILQQTSNYLLGLLHTKQTGSDLSSPLGSVNFIDNIEGVLNQKYKPSSAEEASDPAAIVSAYQWLVCFLLHTSARKLSDELSKGKDPFSSRNDSQVYYLRNLSIAYIESTALKWWFDLVKSDQVPKCLEEILIKLGCLYGLWSMDKHVATFYQGSYFVHAESILYIRQAIVNLCEMLKDDAVSLVDVVALPDSLIQSALGQSDGQLYKNLIAAMVHSSGSMTRPDHWKELVNRPVWNSVPLSAKL